MNTLVLPTVIFEQSSRAAERRHCGELRPSKVSCILLVQADYIGRTPGRGPEGTGKCSLAAVSCHDHCSISGRSSGGKGLLRRHLPSLAQLCMLPSPRTWPRQSEPESDRASGGSCYTKLSAQAQTRRPPFRVSKMSIQRRVCVSTKVHLRNKI